MGSRMKSNGVGRRKDGDVSLNMECGDEDLSEAQLSAYNKAMIQYRETTNSIDNLLRAGVIDITERGQDYISIEFKEGLNGVNGTKVKPPVMPTSGPRPAGTPLLLSNAGVPQPGGTYQLVMDPRGTIYFGSNPSVNPTSSPGSVPVVAGVIPPNVPVAAAISPPAVMRPVVPATPVRAATPRTTRPAAPRTTTPALVPLSSMVNKNNPKGTSAVRIKPMTQTKANEATSVGGIVQSKPSTSAASASKSGSAMVVDLTDEDSRNVNPVADSKEVQFNKLSGKTYPSLVVVARPNLRVKEISQVTTTSERNSLDAKMKAVLMGTPTKFTEWLIQQGLVRSEQHCSVHVNSDMTPIKLKLGMYSDVSKFPYSGGYVWISECCPTRFVSVFSGSIFEGAPHAPTVLVKLLYHWACQTSVNNISQWVKVDGLYVKSFYTNIRSVCTAAVHDKFEKLGGPKKRVELGVISLGTTSQDGNMRQVKVEVLGVYDPESKLIRLRAVEPLQDGERNYKRRFVKILEPLEEWVHKESIILTDYTVDKGTLHHMGYQSVYQVSMADQQGTSPKYSNTQVMDYLRRIVPRMFQNTLSLLSRQIIQQFLDELVWRERWGTIAARAFEMIVSHLAEQTKLDTGDTLMTRLNKIAANPFKNWAYKNWQSNCVAAPQIPTRLVVSNEALGSQTVSAGSNLPSIDNLPPSLRNTDSPNPVSQANKRGRGKGKTSSEPEPKKHFLSVPSSNNLRPLDSYYYGTKPGAAQILASQKHFDLNMKCGMCNVMVKDNLRMMRHLVGHAFNEGSYTFSDNSPQCRYCLKDFISDFALQTHVEESHEKGSLLCQICREANRDRTTLILHMHKNHCEQELPYRCGICDYRASQHNLVVDHFHQFHKNTDKLQCPFCLKIVNLQTVDGRRITQNQYFFINHIQKHQRKTLARKCQKCVLWFVHKDLIKEHYKKDHTSCKELPGVVREPVNGLDVVMMPTPLNSQPQFKSQGNKNKPTFSTTFTINSFQRLGISGVKEDAICCECEGEMLQDDHYPGFLSCLKCRFSTCCSKAMNEHFVVYHQSEAKPQYNVGKAIILAKPLYCVCGFSSQSGNNMARHLALCKRKSAYPTPERAAQCTLQGQSASFPPLVTLDEEEAEDHEEKWMRAFVPHRADSADSDKPIVTPSTSGDPPSMLNLLGLVRKTSSDEEIMEIDDK
ncbi:uncharacterized protein LOC129004035 [Macrosteles quadrilineatus]|uniref:uncharacterized protein LOC129004035 n=1 Tax=Macrosteles quadrilineatus TaxID=74068 RepID=UPI0023E184FB|nr:uncharacterized protein LOC129004035 [Macrosteles quadrilineatus]